MKDRERQATWNKDSEEADMNKIINHLDSIENYYSQKVAESQANVDDCLQELQVAGMFVHVENNQATEVTDMIMLPNDNSLEDQWKNAYENCRNVSRTYSGWSPNVLVGPGVKNRVQLAAIECRSVACVLEGQRHKVTRVGPMDPRVSTKSGVSRVFPEWIQEVRSSGELWSYNIK